MRLPELENKLGSVATELAEVKALLRLVVEGQAVQILHASETSPSRARAARELREELARLEARDAQASR